MKRLLLFALCTAVLTAIAGAGAAMWLSSALRTPMPMPPEGALVRIAAGSSLRKTAAALPLERLLVETDAPYLTPAPFRKIRRNEPCYVVETARKLAEIRNLALEEVGAATSRNFLRLFDLPAPA